MGPSYRSFLSCYASLIFAGLGKLELIFEQVDQLDKLLGQAAAATGVPEVAPKNAFLEVDHDDESAEREVARALQLPQTTFDPSKLRQRWLALQNRPVLAAIFKAAMLALAQKNPALAEGINAILSSIPQKQ